MVKAMLATPAKMPPDFYIRSTKWIMQQKMDGSRLLVILDNQFGTVTGYNRYGTDKVISENISIAFQKIMPNLSPDFGQKIIFDGELIDKTFYIFDMELDICAGLPFQNRNVLLKNFSGMLIGFGISDIKVVPSSILFEDKANLYLKLKEENAEGVIFRDAKSQFSQTGGKTHSLIKLKFIKDIDCVVTEIGTIKQNLILSVYDEHNNLIEIGKVTRLAGDGEKAKLGDVVSVRYMYPTYKKDTGYRLYNPSKAVVRTDKKPSECTLDQVYEHLPNKNMITS